jgi:hypothetical protein
MPFRYEVLHPDAQVVYLLAMEHGSQTHPLNVALWAELAAVHGQGAEVIAEAVEIVNERRAAKGLPLLDPADPLKNPTE